MIRLDTHVVIWLYTGETAKLSSQAAHLVDTEELVISPMVQLELVFLHEIGRLTVSGADIVGDLRQRIGLGLSPTSTIAAVQAAAPLSWTRDPFDRMIVGDALAANVSLLTKDEVIRQHIPLAVW